MTGKVWWKAKWTRLLQCQLVEVLELLAGYGWLPGKDPNLAAVRYDFQICGEAPGLVLPKRERDAEGVVTKNEQFPRNGACVQNVWRYDNVVSSNVAPPI